jgi:hypothetical protein
VNAQLAKKKPELFLDPMNQWHLYSEFKDGKNIGGAIQYVRMFGIIGAFVLLLACINFMNLSTARSEKRAREVGIRKTLGSMRGQLILQFFNESLLTVIFAFGLSLIFVRLALPFFVPRQILVVLQFTVSVTLIIGTIIVYRQIRFAKDRPVGYTRAGIVSIPVSNSSIHDHFKAVQDELMRTGAVAGVTESGSAPTDIGNSTSGFSWEGKDPNLSVDFGQGAISADYGKLVGWHLEAGRDFRKDFATDSAAVILNQAAIKFMGLKNPIGSRATWDGQPYRVIGVVDDMVMGSPYDEVHPMIFSLLDPKNAGDVVLIKISPGTGRADLLSGTIRACIFCCGTA